REEKILIAAIFGVLLLAGAYALSKNSKGYSLYTNGETTETATVAELIERDTDKDGVTDWEESLWGTDPTRADSDGDGTMDKQEIAAMRKASGIAAPIAAATSTNETDAFARQLFSTLLSLKSSGQLDQSTITELSQSLVKEAVSSKLPDRYDSNDLAVVSATAASRQAYAEGLTRVSERYRTKVSESYLVIVERALSSQRETDLAGLEDYANAYNAMAGELIQFGAPNDIAAAHLSLANSYVKLSVSMKNMERLVENPIVGLTGLITYEQELASTGKILDNIKAYFNENGIILGKK
ncbi:thrombospondin type 3 repeat-containing protein, partial [Candidatus Parcubacteria bacterium]|nr:thrombospondin type 3 repeat-containing protein [Candidatus Parcubacteria bacterium]